jgi:amino acid transporter
MEEFMAEETVVFARKASGLVRELNWWDVLLITIAGPAASGMTYYSVKIPGVYPGANMVGAFLLGGLLWLAPVILIAVFASSFPRSGSMYVGISRSTHPILGFIPNWLWSVSCGLSVGFLNYIGLYVLGSAMQLAGHISGSEGWVNAGNWVDDNYHRLWLSLLMTVGVWFLELQGLARLKWFIRTVIYAPLVLTLVALILFFITKGTEGFDAIYGAGAAAKVTALAQEKGITDAIMPSGEALGMALLWVFWAYTAVESISFVGSEVKTPRTSFLRGMGIGFATIVALYCLNAWGPGVSFGSTFVRDYGWLYYNYPDDLAKALGVSAAAAPSIPVYAAFCGKVAWLAVVLGVGYFLWYLNTSVAMWMGTVRAIFAMSFDRQLPLGLCKVGKNGAPTMATHFIGILALIGCFIGLGDALGTDSAAVMIAILDYTGMYFIWTVGLAALFLPFTRPDLFEKSTFQYRFAGMPLMSILGGFVLGVGFYMITNVGLELSRTYAQIGMAAIVCAGLITVAAMYAKNRREGIDPNQIFAQIPPS